MNTTAPPLPSRLQTIFGVDLRSLALFRVLLATTMLCALMGSLCDLTALYSDSGVAPRSWVMDNSTATRLSLYFLNGTSLFTAALLITQLVFALLLLLGWRTRLASMVSFVLWASLMSRNPAALTPADGLIAGLLFWGLFLPLGARYSVESALAEKPESASHHHASWASAGLLLQAIAPWFISTLSVYAAAQPHESMVLHFLLSLDQYSNAAGHWLLGFPDTLAALSRLMFGLSLISPLLIFMPFFTQAARLPAMAGLLAMQLFILLFLDAGALPWAGIAALGVLPGAAVWERLNAWNQGRSAGALRIYYDQDHTFSRMMCRLLQAFLLLPRVQILAAQDTPRTRALLQANQSWVVLDSQDQATMKWPALVTLLRGSPLLFWLAPLLSAVWLEKPGNALYGALARRRAALDPMAARLMGTPEAESEPRSVWKHLPALMLAMLLLWNLSSVRWLPPSAGQIVAPVLELLRLDQTWALYSRSTLENDGWLMVPAKLADGSEVDLLRSDQGAPDFNKPGHAVIAADGLRWLGYRERLWQDNSASQRQLYARYLCRQWNDRHSGAPEKQVGQLSFIYMLERTSAPGTAAQIEQRILGTHSCRS